MQEVETAQIQVQLNELKASKEENKLKTKQIQRQLEELDVGYVWFMECVIVSQKLWNHDKAEKGLRSDYIVEVKVFLDFLALGDKGKVTTYGSSAGTAETADLKTSTGRPIELTVYEYTTTCYVTFWTFADNTGKRRRTPAIETSDTRERVRSRNFGDCRNIVLNLQHCYDL